MFVISCGYRAAAEPVAPWTEININCLLEISNPPKQHQYCHACACRVEVLERRGQRCVCVSVCVLHHLPNPAWYYCWWGYNCAILPGDRSEFIPHTLFPPAGARCNCAVRFIRPVKINPSWKKIVFWKKKKKTSSSKGALSVAGFGWATGEKRHSAGSNGPPSVGDLPMKSTLASRDGYPQTHKQSVRWMQGFYIL